MSDVNKALVILSGGQDSTTCLFWAIRKYDRQNVMALTFDYDQRHKREVKCAEKIALLANVPHETLKIGDILKSTSPLVNKEKKVGQYESAETLPDGLEDTFVPCRNILFITLATNRAIVNDCENIVTGVSQEDYGGYPDCRLNFINGMQHALVQGLDMNINIETPLIDLDKHLTVEMAVGLGEECMNALGHSHTCYNGVKTSKNGTVVGCGKCHACLLRAKGFELAGVIDPILKNNEIHQENKQKNTDR